MRELAIRTGYSEKKPVIVDFDKVTGAERDELITKAFEIADQRIKPWHRHNNRPAYLLIRKGKTSYPFTVIRTKMGNFDTYKVDHIGKNESGSDSTELSKLITLLNMIETTHRFTVFKDQTKPQPLEPMEPNTEVKLVGNASK